MKPFAFLITLSILLIAFNSCTVANSAKNKTNREISKKTNQKIEDIFNKNKNDKKIPEKEGEVTSNKPQNDPDKNVEPTLARNSNDFIPGEKIIFIDSLYRERLGEFPSKWDLRTGNVEVMKFEGEDVIGWISGGTIFPLIDQEDYLPEQFTVEFDCYFQNIGNEAYTLEMNTSGASITIRSDGLVEKTYHRTNVKDQVGWRHISYSFNKRSIKIYFNGERLVNIPNIQKRPTKMAIKALRSGGNSGKYAMIKNIRIAEGGVPLYDRLLTDGKFVTNDIHFEYNKAELKSDSWRTIIKVAEMMKAHIDINLRIEGHTDGDGTDSYNMELSKKRADAVMSAILKEGIPSNRLSTTGFGETKPIANNNSDEGKAANRRVEFILID